jgi:hypothetical protein
MTVGCGTASVTTTTSIIYAKTKRRPNSVFGLCGYALNKHKKSSLFILVSSAHVSRRSVIWHRTFKNRALREFDGMIYEIVNKRLI